MADIEELLRTAGERWRAAQPGDPSIDPVRIVTARRATDVPTGWIVAMSAIVIVLAVGLAGRGGRLDGGGGSLPSTPAPSTTGRDACPVTRPDPPFVPPPGFMATPPVNESGWGSAALWTLLHDDGEDWTGLAQTSTGLRQKTFWWSADWSLEAEPEPAITVFARRLDGTGTLTFGPGTNASASAFGTAMLVGIDLPTGGCWKISARYRSAELAYVVWVRPAMAAPTATAEAVEPAPSSTSTPGPIQTLSPEAGDVGTMGPEAIEARATAMGYEDALAAQSWDVAWGYLAPFSQQRIGSLADFIAGQVAFQNDGGATYEIGSTITGPFDETIAGYIGADLLADIERAGVPPARTLFVYVTHPGVDYVSAGTRAYVVAQVGGAWRIWIAR